jgi:hypothetical protein
MILVYRHEIVQDPITRILNWTVFFNDVFSVTNLSAYIEPFARHSLNYPGYKILRQELMNIWLTILLTQNHRLISIRLKAKIYEIVFAAEFIVESPEPGGNNIITISRYSHKTNAWEDPSYYSLNIDESKSSALYPSWLFIIRKENW